MSRISALNHPGAGTAAALLGDEGRSPSDSTQSEMTISQMSRLFGVSLRTLRFYEDRGLIKPRREGNARYYRAADRVRMEMILKGFTLTEIQDLIGGKGTAETPDLEEQLNAQQIMTQIGHLERQRVEIDSAIERLRATQSRLASSVAADRKTVARAGSAHSSRRGLSFLCTHREARMRSVASRASSRAATPSRAARRSPQRRAGAHSNGIAKSGLVIPAKERVKELRLGSTARPPTLSRPHKRGRGR